MPPTRPFLVVFVCTANRARSPLAASLFLRHAQGTGAAARSYGIAGRGGEPALPQAVEAGRRYGADLTQHQARILVPRVLADADLVVGFERDHVSTAVVEGGAARERCFLFRQVVELLDEAVQGADRDARARARVAAAGERNALTDARRLEIPDPAGKPDAVMYETAAEIDRLAAALVRGLFGVPGSL